MIRRPPRSTLFPYTRSSDLVPEGAAERFVQVHALTRHDEEQAASRRDRKSTRLNSSHLVISYAVFCLKKKKKQKRNNQQSTEIDSITAHLRDKSHKETNVQE